MMVDIKNDIFAFIKPIADAHTLGVNSVAGILEDCGYQVIIADEAVEKAMNDYKNEIKREFIIDWILRNKVTKIGFSYRLDQQDALNMVGYFIVELKRRNMLFYQGGPIKAVYFGGLPKACEIINIEFKGFVKTFSGGESVYETLIKLDVPEYKIPKSIIEGSKYDDMRMEFGKKVIDTKEYDNYMPIDRSCYGEYGTYEDSVVNRIDKNIIRNDSFAPLMRAHVGPYSSSKSRMESVKEFVNWSKILADAGYLDILSIGSSQLTQSGFGENWGNKLNGGGVPVNSPEEYKMIYEASRPLLVRTYAGTKNIYDLARMHEDTLNICWHALSFWWFNKLDERGPYDLYTNLKQHIETLKYIAATNKPFEPNVPHQFAFRGADDVTYIVSAYLSAKLAKKMGIKTLILQNMLNTPKSTWGIQDLAKSRVMINLVKELEDSNFRILLQPRAGLDYFKPDMYEAKIQLSAVTALMDDIDPYNKKSPPIIHVVSYTEASHLADPTVINESIKITQHSIEKYRQLRKKGEIMDMAINSDVQERMLELYNSAKTIIAAIEKNIDNPYSAEGFYMIFASGFMPVPYLWREVEEFKHAKVWKTRIIRGGAKIVDAKNEVVGAEKLVEHAKHNICEAKYNLMNR